MKNQLPIIFLTMILFALSSCKTASGYRNCYQVMGYCNGEIPITNPGHKYIGEAYNRKAHGYGEYYWPGSHTYNGNWINNVRTGKGTIKFHNPQRSGDVCTGEFLNNYMHGKGIYKFSNGDIYSGDFVSHKFDGVGIITYVSPNTKNGWISYEGEFKNGFPNGKGKATYPDGKIVTGIFDNNRLVSKVKDQKQKTKTNKNVSFDMLKAKKECIDLGFKDKSEKFGECVMELIN